MPAENTSAAKGKKRILQGVVLSNKADKTITVQAERTVIHPLFKKYYKKHKKFMAHDEANDCKIGDIVKIQENRPLSKNKRWVLVEIVERAK
ncbi:MAG: 30S ribosomal protein S17 [Candidatus Kapabacteria bacterium]|nr:30S ribosomal protein S17 [Candidatus Kapabacteria bacterium]